MTEFWESSFIENQMMWGFEPEGLRNFNKGLFS